MIKLWSEITSGSVQSFKGHICFTKSFLLIMGSKISGWRFLKFWFFYVGFYCTAFNYEKCKTTKQQKDQLNKFKSNSKTTGSVQILSKDPEST